MRKGNKLKFVTVLSVILLVVTSCGSATSSGGRSILRFAFAPDPVIDWLNDQGIIPEYEDQYNVRLVMSSTWDEFTYFAGGHGDVVSIATYEIPVLEKETGIKTVTFGSYNNLRVPVITRADNPAKTLEDLVGKKIGVPSAVSSTLVWGMFAKKFYGLTFLVGEGDFDLVIGDHFVNVDLVERGELDACLCIPEAAVPGLRAGTLKVLYDGKQPWEIYESELAPGHKGLNGNNFVAREDWFNSHPNEVQFFLALWERGLKEWHEHQEEIIRTYPQHFAVEEDADVDYMIQYISEHDWFADTVYLDEDWVRDETKVYDLMKETGFMDADAPTPRFEAVAAK